MVVQEMAYAMTNQNETITIVAEVSKQEVDASAYLMRRLLATAQALSANDQLRITVKEEDFEGIKKYLGK